KPHLASTQNLSPTALANDRRAALEKNRVKLQWPGIPKGTPGEVLHWGVYVRRTAVAPESVLRTVAVVIGRLSGQGGLSSLYALRIQVPKRKVSGESVPAPVHRSVILRLCGPKNL